MNLMTRRRWRWEEGWEGWEGWEIAKQERRLEGGEIRRRWERRRSGREEERRWERWRRRYRECGGRRRKGGTGIGQESMKA